MPLIDQLVSQPRSLPRVAMRNKCGLWDRIRIVASGNQNPGDIAWYRRGRGFHHLGPWIYVLAWLYPSPEM
jgi:hypothetical protein